MVPAPSVAGFSPRFIPPGLFPALFRRERRTDLLLISLQEVGVSILYVLACVSDILPRFGVAR